MPPQHFQVQRARGLVHRGIQRDCNTRFDREAEEEIEDDVTPGVEDDTIVADLDQLGWKVPQLASNT